MKLLVVLFICLVLIILTNFIDTGIEKNEQSLLHRFFEPTAQIIYRLMHKFHFIRIEDKYFQRLRLNCREYLIKTICIVIEVIFAGLIIIALTSQKNSIISPIFDREETDKTKELYYVYKNKLNQYTLDIEKREVNFSDIDRSKLRNFIYERLVANNSNTELIDSNLNFISEIEEFNVRIYWDYDDKIIDYDGKIHPDLKEVIKTVVIANISYKDISYKEEFTLNIKPKDEVDDRYIDNNIKKSTRSIELPKNDGDIIWYDKVEESSYKKIIAVLIVALFTGYLLIKKVRIRAENRNEQLEMAFSHFVSVITIYLDSGNNFIQTWRLIVQDLEMYEVLSDLINKSVKSIDNGMSIETSLENFAKECDVEEYRRLIQLILQNFKKGSQDLLNKLKEELVKSQSTKLDNMKLKAQKLQTKMMLPLMLMLAVVFLIVMAPTIISMG